MRKPRPFLTACALALIIACGAWLRLRHLGQPSFNIDEYLHVFAAQAYNARGAFELPSGEPYRRAYPYTWIVAQSFRWLGVSEFSARLPGALIDLLFLGAAYLAARMWWGRFAGLIACGLLAVSPWFVVMAQNCRMYSLFHLLYVAAPCALWRALEGPPKHRWRWAAVAVLLAGFALLVHRLALSMALGAGLFIAGMAFARRSRQDLWLLGGLVLAAGASLATGALDLADLWARANSAPEYARYTRYQHDYYVQLWWRAYPAVLLLYPIALAWIARRRGALAWFVLCMGLVPLAVHSVVMDWKTLRYSLYVFPWFVLPVAGLASAAAAWLWERRRLWSMAAAAALIAATVAPRPGLSRSAESQYAAPAWRACYAWLAPQMAPDEPIVTSMPLATQYYLGRPASYVLNNAHAEMARSKRRRTDAGLRVEWYSGKPMLTTLAELEQAVAAHPSGWLLMDEVRFGSEATLTPEMHAFISGRMTRVPFTAPGEDTNPIVIYRWDRATQQGGA